MNDLELVPKTIHIMAPSPQGLNFLEGMLLIMLPKIEEHSRLMGSAGFPSLQTASAEATASVHALLYAIREVRGENNREIAEYNARQQNQGHPGTIMVNGMVEDDDEAGD